MDNILAEFVDSDTPKLNPILAEGIAVEHMKHSEKYIDDILRDVFKNFSGGLRYMGLSRISPYEEYEQTKRKMGKGNKPVYDLARSDLYMIKLHFQFTDANGVTHDINRYLYMPNPGEAGSITLSAAKYFISPVLADKVISIGMNNIFVRLLCDKLTFERLNQTIVVDEIRETVQIPFSSIYHKNAKARQLRPKVKAVTTIAHYMFARFGLTETFKKYTNTNVVYGNSETINLTTHPDKDWVIYRTARGSIPLKPKGCRGMGDWQPTQLRLAIPRSEINADNNNKVRSLVAGFFYIADHYPKDMLVQYLDDIRLWRKIMGIIIFSETISVGKLLDDINEHFKSLDNYVDPYAAAKLRTLKRVNRPVNDIYDLFDLILGNIDSWLRNASDEVSTMYDKELNVLYFVLMEITKNIYLLYYKLNAASKKGLSLNEIVNTMNTTLRVGLIHAIRRSHGEVRVQTTSGDNKALKITSILVPQSSSNAQGPKKDRSSESDPSKRLHASVAEIGGYLNLPKNEPSGRSRINLNQELDGMEDVIRNPKFIDLLADVQSKIRRI